MRQLNLHESYGLSVNEFLKPDMDDLEIDELRDLWLIIGGALAPLTYSNVFNASETVYPRRAQILKLFSWNKFHRN